MSLYCFGKLRLEIAHRASFAFPAGVSIRMAIDAGDAEDMESIDQIAGEGSYFSICDHTDSAEATGLWNETISCGSDKIAETSLGAAVHELLFDPRISIGALAFVDGGIGAVLTGTPEQCWACFQERAGKPWDTIDNPLLIWASMRELR